MTGSKITTIINCAAYTNVNYAENNFISANLVNCIAVGYLCKICHKYKIKLIHISTDYVFDHPDVDGLYNRVSKIDPKISIATVYRTVKLFEEAGILTKHDFKGGKARYEAMIESHHDHLIDIKTGEIIEFVDDEIEKLQKKVAEKYGYKLVDHKLELYGVKKKPQ